MDAYSPSVPQYQYQEYPKWLYCPAASRSVLVQNAAEEAALEGIWFNSKAEADAANDKKSSATPDAAVMAEFEKAIASAPEAILSTDSDWTVEKCVDEICGYFAFADYADVAARITASVEKLRAERQAAAEAEAKSKAEADAEAEMEALRDQATELGIKVDGRWAAERLRQEIANAQQAAAASKSGESTETTATTNSET